MPTKFQKMMIWVILITGLIFTDLFVFEEWPNMEEMLLRAVGGAVIIAISLILWAVGCQWWHDRRMRPS